ncbi:unnamed protein product [Durusdinium trenchii]|uniref:Fibronectin type-III domain-containing protein n=1 Tax=Durusdinium trenchii TaxID=1381693 RepID=A0ABP0LT70_9DINO
MRSIVYLLSCGAVSSEPSAADRRLYGVPLVTDLDFFDTDLVAGSVGATLTWVPPTVLSEVIGYTVYLADSAGSSTGRVTLGSVLVGTNLLAVPAGTAVNNSLTHLFVHSESNLGLRPDGAGLEICDVSATDTLFLQNAAASTYAWGIPDLSFHRLPDCSDTAMLFAQPGLSGSESGYGEANAFDGDSSTPWVSSCSSCTVGQALIGVVGVCKPEEVRCVKLRQCTAGRGDYGCPSSASRMSRVSLLAKGEHVFTWNFLQGQTSSVLPALEMELLMLPSRRRRATVSAFVDVSYQVQADAEVNPGFSSR